MREYPLRYAGTDRNKKKKYHYSCANFVTSKPHVNCKILKPKKLAQRDEKYKSQAIVFVCFSVMNVGLLQMQWVYKTHRIVVCPRYDKVCTVQCQSETCFRMTRFSERHTMSIWNTFQDGTCFRTARNTRVVTWGGSKGCLLLYERDKYVRVVVVCEAMVTQLTGWAKTERKRKRKRIQ